MSSSRLPKRSPIVCLLLVAGLFGAVLGGLEAAVALFFAAAPTGALHLALATIAFEIASGTLALGLARRPLSAPVLPVNPPRLSVLIAACNEAAGIADTLRSIRAQTRVELEVIVADDGSTDGTGDAVAAAFDLPPNPDGSGFSSASGDLRVLTLPHRGKGWALNAAAAAARHALLVTVDADTVLAPLALARLATAFEDPAVASATGSVLVGKTSSLLTRFQQIEYVRNTLIRVAWSELSALEQLPGAFSAIRAEKLRAAGGYPVRSLTEDYEVTYRLYEDAARTGEELQVAAVPTACAYTEAPDTLAALARQRTRWFAGFLTTLYRFRHLIGDRRAGVFGLVKLPVKVIDAVHPLLSLASLLVLAVDAHDFALRPLAVALFCVRWGWDSLTLALSVRFARKAGARVDLGAAGSLWPWIFVLLDGVSYFWLRQLAVLRAYLWALRSPASWGPERGPASEPVAARVATNPGL